jgi:hypothetical protein
MLPQCANLRYTYISNYILQSGLEALYIVCTNAYLVVSEKSNSDNFEIKFS